MTPLATLAADLKTGETISRALIEAALAAIEDPAGEGARTMLKVNAAQAREAADACDHMRAAGIVPSPIAGLPISVKDLFDLAGETTTAGSVLLKDAPPATEDAPAIARLRRAGAIVMGRVAERE